MLAGLSAAAVAAPLLDLYGRNPEVFVANRSSTAQIVGFALLVATVPVLTAAVLLLGARLVGPRTGLWTYRALVVAGGLAVGSVVSRQLAPDNTVVAVSVSVAVAVAVFLLQDRLWGVLRLFSLALPAVIIMFLVFSPTARLIWGEPAAANEGDLEIVRPSPIYFIQLDELPTASLLDRDGMINDALFPNFAGLAATGTWYRNAFSSSIATSQSVPAALTGVMADPGLSPTSVDHPENLFTLLGGTYEMHVIEHIAELCPEDLCEDFAGRAPARFASLLGDVGVVYGHLTLPEPVREQLPGIDNSWKGFLGQQDTPAPGTVSIDDHPVPPTGVRSKWIDWMQRIIDGVIEDPPPTLHYAHLEAPHVPWQVNPSGTHYQRPGQYTEVDGVQGAGGRWIDDPEIARLGYQRHFYQLGFVDRMLGSLFERIRETEGWDDALIIVVADHGASFVAGEHRRWPYEDNRDDLYRVPLFVKYPDQTTGEVRDEPAFTIDIMPTIVDTLGIATDWSFDGLSLRSIEGTNRPHEIIHWCCSTEGADTRLSSLFAQVERNFEWVPDQSSWQAVASVGPYRDIVGMDLSELTVEADDRLRWSIDHPDLFESADRSSGMIQTLITGRVEYPQGTTVSDFLIAVNGTVSGTGFITTDSVSGGEIRGLISEEAVQDGSNDVVLLLPDGSGGWITGTSQTLDVRYLADDGHVLELGDEGNRRLQVDRVDRTETGWTIEGWAADVSAKVPPDRIYVFAGEVLIAFGPPNVDNENVVRWFKSDDLLRSGFRFEVDGEDVPPELERLVVVAEFGDYAISDPASLTD